MKSLPNKNVVFRPTASELKADSVTKIAKGMVDADTSVREAKTQRLRAARLERDKSEKAQKATSLQKKSRKSSAKAQSAD